MTKDEIKNKISMSLKDPILQQGFEIICKNLAELEKENAELKKTVIKMNKVKTETFSNLTKAKELLERLLITSCNSDVLNLLPNCSEVLRVRVEAEQFLSEVILKRGREMKPIKCCATCIHYWNCKYKNCRNNNWEHWESEVK